MITSNGAKFGISMFSYIDKMSEIYEFFTNQDLTPDQRRQYRSEMLKNHPDHGGSNEAFRATQTKWERIAREGKSGQQTSSSNESFWSRTQSRADADEQRRASEQRAADEKRRASEQRAADEKRRASEQRAADEKRRASEHQQKKTSEDNFWEQARKRRESEDRQPQKKTWGEKILSL
jgi:hypothetical protein